MIQQPLASPGWEKSATLVVHDHSRSMRRWVKSGMKTALDGKIEGFELDAEKRGELAPLALQFGFTFESRNTPTFLCEVQLIGEDLEVRHSTPVAELRLSGGAVNLVDDKAAHQAFLREYREGGLFLRIRLIDLVHVTNWSDAELGRRRASAAYPGIELTELVGFWVPPALLTSEARERLSALPRRMVRPMEETKVWKAFQVWVLHMEGEQSEAPGEHDPEWDTLEQVRTVLACFDFSEQRLRRLGVNPDHTVVHTSNTEATVESDASGAARRNSQVSVFVRESAVVVAAKQRARGRCEYCGQRAPFVDDKGSPYLEAHHVIPMSENGPDTIDNVVALCANCHRLMHYGADRHSAREQLLTRLRGIS